MRQEVFGTEQVVERNRPMYVVCPSCFKVNALFFSKMQAKRSAMPRLCEQVRRSFTRMSKFGTFY